MQRRRPNRRCWPRPSHCIVVLPLLMLAWQYRQLQALPAVRTGGTPPAMLQPAAALAAPASPAVTPAVSVAAASHRPALVDGEYVGGTTSTKLCVVMPVRSSNLPHALRNVRSWAKRGAAAPCELHDAPAAADLAFFHAQDFSGARDTTLAA